MVMIGKKLVFHRALQPGGCIWDFANAHLAHPVLLAIAHEKSSRDELNSHP